MNPNTTESTDDPLHLTVHSLPVSSALRDRPSQMGARLKLALLLLVCAAPVIASYLTYYVIRPEGRRNNGDLIDPQQPLPAVQVTTLQGSHMSLPSLRGQWLLIAVADKACDPKCQNNIYFQRQLQKILGKDSDRLDKVLVLLADTTFDASQMAALNDTTVLKANRHDIVAWLKPSAGHTIDDHLYVVDPLGNWMMRLPPNMDLNSATQSKRDLERLMKASSFWDKAGRN